MIDSIGFFDSSVHSCRKVARSAWNEAGDRGAERDFALFAAAWGDERVAGLSSFYCDLLSQQRRFADYLQSQGNEWGGDPVLGGVSRVLRDCRNCHLAYFSHKGSRSYGVRHRPFSSCRFAACAVCEEARYRSTFRFIASHMDGLMRDYRFVWGEDLGSPPGRGVRSRFFLVTVAPRRQGEYSASTGWHTDNVFPLDDLLFEVEQQQSCMERMQRWVEWRRNVLGWASALHLKPMWGRDAKWGCFPHRHFVLHVTESFDAERVQALFLKGFSFCDVDVKRLVEWPALRCAVSYMARSRVRQDHPERSGSLVWFEKKSFASDLLSYDEWAAACRIHVRCAHVRRFSGGGTLKRLFTGLYGDDSARADARERKVYDRLGEKTELPLFGRFVFCPLAGRLLYRPKLQEPLVRDAVTALQAKLTRHKLIPLASVASVGSFFAELLPSRARSHAQGQQAEGGVLPSRARALSVIPIRCPLGNKTADFLPRRFAASASCGVRDVSALCDFSPWHQLGALAHRFPSGLRLSMVPSWRAVRGLYLLNRARDELQKSRNGLSCARGASVAPRLCASMFGSQYEFSADQEGLDFVFSRAGSSVLRYWEERYSKARKSLRWAKRFSQRHPFTSASVDFCWQWSQSFFMSESLVDRAFASSRGSSFLSVVDGLPFVPGGAVSWGAVSKLWFGGPFVTPLRWVRFSARFLATRPVPEGKPKP